MKANSLICVFSLTLVLTACGGSSSSINTDTAAGMDTTDTTELVTETPATTESTMSTTRISFEVSSVLKLPEVIDNYSDPELPTHFRTQLVQSFDNTPLDNIISDAVATLGRVLFYEKQLSANDSIACASCHIQANGFSDPNQFSSGFQGGLTDRNSMSLANSQYYERGHFFWDERAGTLEDQILVPIQDDVEMGITLEQAESKLIAQNYYPFLFQEAFGDTNVTAIEFHWHYHNLLDL